MKRMRKENDDFDEVLSNLNIDIDDDEEENESTELVGIVAHAVVAVTATNNNRGGPRAAAVDREQTYYLLTMCSHTLQWYRA